jgi:flagellar motor switch/type III secretory pathway protein FliN
LHFHPGVNASALIPAELEAIQAAIREVALPRGAPFGARHPNPAERVAATARLLELARHWAGTAPTTLRGHLPSPSQVRVEGVEFVEGRAARAQVHGAWLAAARVDQDPALVIAIHGSVIETIAARRCGDSIERTEACPAPAVPSAVALRLFEPAGWAVLQSWAVAWMTMGLGELVPTRAATDIADLLDGDSLLRVSIAWSGRGHGRCVLYVAPAALVEKSQWPPNDDAVREVLDLLAQAPVEVRVELGALRLTLDELAQMQPGSTFALPTFVDSRVPVFVGGVLKAWGIPVIHRGVLAISVEQVVGARGTRS